MNSGDGRTDRSGGSDKVVAVRVVAFVVGMNVWESYEGLVGGVGIGVAAAAVAITSGERP